ncbi:Branched-chain amino acid transport system 2 carrier protein [Oligella urethralis]|uniref:branched-chain amino acid transport system II carrier protein n=1 Tax=Oligella urethralis TaxID=90245 RepID=UPI0029584402|nr:branched-chain amino acid transport system II carrier protein [Oligella urethralis]WOS37649.1 Branched-chain amino acid transport system 2 carrier protein [Oligella urethralis]
MSVQASKKSPLALFVSTGLMLFALFFGAGNLIFPAHMGQQAGANYLEAVMGFVLTGAGLPLLGILAMSYSGARDVQHLASRVSPLFGVFFAVTLYLSIGPLFAMPRTATVAYEVGVSPYLGSETSSTWGLLLFSIAFFAVAFWLAMSPSKLLDRIGKILTPVLLVSIAILAFKSLLDPMGELTAPQGAYAVHPVVEGFLAGYQTMDALASLVFAIVVIGVLQAEGVKANEQLMRLTMGAGLLAALCLAVVYGLVTYLGAGSVEVTGWLSNGAAVLSETAHYYWGSMGNLLLLVIILLACLSTAVGLIAACAEYFSRLMPQLSYKLFVIIFTLISCGLANKGLEGIINFSIPVLMLLYPLTVVLILLTFANSLFKGRRIVYVCTMLATLAVSLVDAWDAAFTLSPEAKAWLASYLPWHAIGLGWIVPALLGMLVGLILSAAGFKKTVS